MPDTRGQASRALGGPTARSAKMRGVEAEPPPDDTPRGDEIPPRIVLVAYLLSALCLILPLALIGAAFAGIVLIRRGKVVDGAAVLILGVLGVVVGLLLFR